MFSSASRCTMRAARGMTHSVGSPSSSALLLHRTGTSLRHTAGVVVRANSGVAPNVIAKYPGSLRVLHWVSGAGIVVCVGTVIAAQEAEKGDPIKGRLMHLHKSAALITAGAMVLRVGVRLATRMPPPVPGPKIEQFLGAAGHTALYAFGLFMPATGIAMGYFGGKGLPFFNTKIEGAAEPNGAIAKRSYQLHKLVGYYGKFLIPLHIGAAGLHLVRGQNVLRRIIF